MSLRIIKAGLLDTVQDPGRYGYQHLGINPGGAMDRFSASLGNALLGKSLSAPVIELHFPAAQILFQKPAVIVLTGADFSPCINGEEVVINQPIAVHENVVLSFAKKRHGARCYLSILNDLHLEPWLNSHSTNLKAAAGGYCGRPLKAGDEIAFPDLHFFTLNNHILLPWKYGAEESFPAILLAMTGPEWHWLTENSRQDFLNRSFTITTASDRMGYRLQAPALAQQQQEQLLSSGVTFGTVQLLPNGQLIILMSDHQTTGGYPRIANVIAAHLPKLAQMNPGESLRFALTTIEAAEKKWMAQQQYLVQLQDHCQGRMAALVKQNL